MKEFTRLLRLLGPYRRDLVIGCLMVLVESVLELIIPVLMSDIIDVGVANQDVPYILHKGLQMGICAVLALITGLLYARFSARAAYAIRISIRDAQFERCRSTPFPIWTALRPPRW